ncbi:MAG TPA: peptidylprolyl isomerase [Pirellulales bacterium]|jgi:parvulin-like peptidyl-prolyl isomerase|nr:peptidylprolyl isomerase [Pirellulales bacterium]
MTENQGKRALRGLGGWRQRTGLLASGLVVFALCLAVRYAGPPPGAAAAGKDAPSAKKSAKQPVFADDSRQPESTAKEKPGVVAVVNGEPITREKLGEECLQHFGDEVLDTLVSKQLIVEQCKARGIEVTHEEVRAELDHMAERFGLPTDQLLKMLKDERHITPNQYAKEIIWPTVALRKLAAKELQVTEKEIHEAYDVLYGPSVQTRLIACNTAEEANKVRALAVKEPDDFPNLAMKYSRDPSAGSKGLIQPIHKHEGTLDVEQAAFALKVGEISQVIKAYDRYVILKCEAHVPAQGVPKAEVRDQLIESVRDTKLRTVAVKLLTKLKKEGHFKDVFNDSALRKRHPGVAAIVEGHEITMRELAEDCIDRHGIEVLEAMISHRLLEQACRKKKITISQADVQAEIERSAIAAGCTKKKKSGNDVADVAAWLQDVKEHQGLTEEIYRQEVAWPAAALKKLVGKDVEISDEDMRKSYQANYGKRVRCRAIVFDRERKAHQVWTALRDQRSRIEEEYPSENERDELDRLALDEFAKAAGQYSVDKGSREVQGQIPPIARYGTDPLMEKEAFALKAGEMSGVIQVADKYVILYCEGFTKPAQTTFDEVKQEITADLREKKMRVAIAQQYAKLNDLAQIENYLTGTSKTPESGNPVNTVLGGAGLLAEPAPADEPPRRKPPAKTVKATGSDTRR